MTSILPYVSHLAGYALSILLTYTTLRLLYNVFLHPLRKYPGPFLSKATILNSQYRMVTGQLHTWVHEVHRTYGPVVRLGPNELSFIESDAWKDIYGHKTQSRQAEFTKDIKFYGPDVFSGEEPGLIRANELAHARQRKLVAHAFSDKALREQQELLKGYVIMFVERLKEKAAKREAVNIVDWFNFTTFDIMADLTFGESLRLLKEGNYSIWVRSVFGNIKMLSFTQAIRPWPILDRLLNRMIPQSLKEKRKAHMDHSITRVEKRLARKTERPDIWTYVMRHSQDDEHRGKGLTLKEMHSNAGLFMLAGTETTATQLSNLAYQLLAHPHCMERLIKEVRNAFPTYEDMTMQALAQLEYLNAVVEEGLRIYPPVPIGTPRTVPAPGGVVAGKFVPEGVTVAVSQYATYHSQENFKDPDSFRPERWLLEGEKEFAEDRKFALQPFSYGPRNCLGKNLAYHEMRLILSSLLWNFDLKVEEQSGVWSDQKSFILWNKKPLMVTLTPIQRN